MNPAGELKRFPVDICEICMCKTCDIIAKECVAFESKYGILHRSEFLRGMNRADNMSFLYKLYRQLK